MADLVFNGAKQYLGDGTIDYLTDSIYAAILSGSYTPDQDAHDNWGDVKSYEVSGAGYTTGGKALTDKTVTHDDTINKGKYDAGDLTWVSVTFSGGRYLLIYKYTGVDATSKLICVLDFGENKSPGAIDFQCIFGTNGVFTMS